MEKNNLSPPQDFNFPFAPYSIQVDFMVQLFKTVEFGHVGIFESPTGTGKSLSLVCSSLTWLRLDEERRRKEFDALMNEESSASDEDWIRAFAEKEEKQDKNGDFIERHRDLEKREKELLRWKRDPSNLRGTSFKKRKIPFGGAVCGDGSDEDNDDSATELDEDAKLLLENYDSDDDDGKATGKHGEDVRPVDTPKIIFCSRTHSQLAQVLNEVKRTSFSKDIRCVTLGSRQAFCINDAVRKLNQASLINDRCLQLQKDKTEKVAKMGRADSNSAQRRSKKGCPFYKRAIIEEFSNSLLLNGIRDVEEIVSEGRDLKACPYYASRQSVAAAHLVLAPYQVLLHKATRDACGLALRGNILIIDEAHNLLDTLSAIHSVEIGSSQLDSARLQLRRYLERFGSRLSPKNLMYIRQLEIATDQLLQCLKRAIDDERFYSLAEFVFHCGIDTINMFKLLRFMDVSRITEKLNGYANRHSQETGALASKEDSEGSTSPFHVVQSFLGCLVERSGDGRVIVTRGNPNGTNQRPKLKFVHLNPAVHFVDLCAEARSVVLAGGTMEPVSDLVEQLFTPCGVTPTSIDRFSCGHVVDDENLLPLVLEKGPSGVPFDFTFANRSNETMVGDLGRLLTNMSNVVPGGIVCFFQSYDYEAFVVESWSRSGVLKLLEKKKKVFREPQRASNVNKVLDGFAKSAASGAIMFAVVGGKLSEGINFANELGRMVVMVGMPYPNSRSVELKEKMRVLNERSGDGQRGQQYYENLCMKAVNQSIGRVIRHQHDYAVILLLDKGYSKPAIQKKLPCWIRKLVVISDSFGSSFAVIRKFFTRMASKSSDKV